MYKSLGKDPNHRIGNSFLELQLTSLMNVKRYGKAVQIRLEYVIQAFQAIFAVAIRTAPVRRLCICYSYGSQKISLDFSVIADSCLSKLLYLPLEGLSDPSECPFFEPN